MLWSVGINYGVSKGFLGAKINFKEYFLCISMATHFQSGSANEKPLPQEFIRNKEFFKAPFLRCKKLRSFLSTLKNVT